MQYILAPDRRSGQSRLTFDFRPDGIEIPKRFVDVMSPRLAAAQVQVQRSTRVFCINSQVARSKHYRSPMTTRFTLTAGGIPDDLAEDLAEDGMLLARLLAAGAEVYAEVGAG